jgi:hypothetical protein
VLWRKRAERQDHAFDQAVTGRYREAVESLRLNLEKEEDWALAYDLFFWR